MAQSCIDWDPDPRVASAQCSILHITKVPPSSSGIARHAGAFDRALDMVGDRCTIGLPVEAHQSQRAVLIFRLCRRVRRHVRENRTDLVVIDLSGRALAEFFAACVIAAHRQRPRIWLVAHDAPDLVGPPLLVALLDRKGGRRLGMELSGILGGQATRWLLRRSAALLAFSELGASALRERFGDEVSVWSVPLPTELLADKPKGRDRVLPIRERAWPRSNRCSTSYRPADWEQGSTCE